jgi:hypothetical protein
MLRTSLSVAAVILHGLSLQILLHLRNEIRLNLYSALIAVETLMSLLIRLMASARLTWT